MIYVDQRIGSKDLEHPLRALGLPVELTHLEFADIAFHGRGEGDRPIAVGIELKKLGDLVSSLRTGRLSGHQVPGLVGPQGAYDYAWVLVEGQYAADATGRLVSPGRGARGHRWKPVPGGMNVAELEKRLLTLELCAGLHTRFCNSRPDTLRWLHALYRWWTDQSQDRHSSHLAVQTVASVVPLSPFRQAACHWPGIGVKTSKAVEARFDGSVLAAAQSSWEVWAAIEVKDAKGHVRRLGEPTARRIVQFLRGDTP